MIPWPVLVKQKCKCPLTQEDVDVMRALHESWAGLQYQGKEWSPLEFAERIERHLKEHA